MIRNLRNLSLVILATVAAAAVLASPASAAHTFTSEVAPVVVTGKQETKAIIGFHGTGLKIECGESTMNGTEGQKTREVLTVQPRYTQCKWGEMEALVNTGDCDYLLYGETTMHFDTEGSIETDAPVSIECTAGKTIVVTVGGCTIKVGPQKVHGVTYVNETEKEGAKKEDVTVKVTLDQIKYTTEGFTCAFAGLPKEGEDAYVTGNYTFKGYIDEDGPTAKHQSTFKEGAQINYKMTIKP